MIHPSTLPTLDSTASNSSTWSKVTPCCSFCLKQHCFSELSVFSPTLGIWGVSKELATVKIRGYHIWILITCLVLFLFFLSCFTCKCCKNILFVKSSYLRGVLMHTESTVGVQVFYEKFWLKKGIRCCYTTSAAPPPTAFSFSFFFFFIFGGLFPF